MLCYALTRYTKPGIVVDIGVAYWTTISLALLAMEENNLDRLISIDLPSLSYHDGSCIGMAVSKHLIRRWTSYLGNSRRWLPKILNEKENIELFIADGDNIYTLHRYEFTPVWNHFSNGGAAIVNKIGKRFYKILQITDVAQIHAIWQIENSLCVTGLILKK